MLLYVQTENSKGSFSNPVLHNVSGQVVAKKIGRAITRQFNVKVRLTFPSFAGQNPGNLRAYYIEKPKMDDVLGLDPENDFEGNVLTLLSEIDQGNRLKNILSIYLGHPFTIDKFQSLTFKQVKTWRNLGPKSFDSLNEVLVKMGIDPISIIEKKGHFYNNYQNYKRRELRKYNNNQ